MQARIAVRRVAKKELTQERSHELYGVPTRTMRSWLDKLKAELKVAKTTALKDVPDEKLDSEIACLSIGKVGRPAYLNDDTMAVLIMRSVLLSLAGNEMNMQRVGDECRNLLLEMAELEEEEEIRARMAKAVCGPDVVKRGVQLTEEILGAPLDMFHQLSMHTALPCAMQLLPATQYITQKSRSQPVAQLTLGDPLQAST